MQIIETNEDLIQGIDALCRLDARFSALYERNGLPPLRRSPEGFEQLCYIITEQMISLSAAAAIWQRTRDALPSMSPAGVLSANDEAFRAAGQSRSKQKTLRSLACEIVDGRLDLERLRGLDDDSVRCALTAVNGIGPWTAEVYLLSCLGRPDAWPGGDIALRIAAHSLYRLHERPDVKQMEHLAEPWRPWRAIAARLLWAEYRVLKGLPPT